MYSKNRPLRPSESSLILQAQFEGLSVKELQVRDLLVETKYMEQDEATTFIKKIGLGAAAELYELMHNNTFLEEDLLILKAQHTELVSH